MAFEVRMDTVNGKPMLEPADQRHAGAYLRVSHFPAKCKAVRPKEVHL
jgi:hypothetical protein